MARAPKKRDEHAIQSSFFNWVRLQENAIPELRLMHAIPNGGHRHAAVAKRLKAEGVRAGVFDTFLPVARGGFHGLYIEFKCGANTLSPSQEAFQERANKEGYLCFTVWEAADAVKIVENYLNNKLKLLSPSVTINFGQ